MRRLLAITIALLLGFTLTAPLFVSSSSTAVPECCRRNGMHHCMGQMVDPSSDKAFLHAVPKCPRFPVASPAPRLDSLVPNRSLSVSLPLFVRPASLPQTEARYRIAYARSRQKRGPPVILL
jgi:hypothetical protein